MDQTICLQMTDMIIELYGRENGGKTLQIEGPGPLFNLPVGALLKGIGTPEIPTV